MAADKSLLLYLLIFLLSFKACTPFGWFSSSKSQTHVLETPALSSDNGAEFSIDALNDNKGIERLKNAKSKSAVSKSCWHDAYQGIFAKCSEISDDDNEKRKRFAWDLSNCFHIDSGRHHFPPCPLGFQMKKCLGKLDNNVIHTYREFFLETNSICHQLQSQAFTRHTERLVNDLKSSAHYAEEKLESIEKKSDHLLEDSKDIHEFLTKIDEETREVAQTSKNVSNHIGHVLKQSEAVFEQSEKIAVSQTELQKGQETMKEKVEEGIQILHQSYNDLGKEIKMIQNEAIEIERKITKVGGQMSKKMSSLQSKAEDITNVAGDSLSKQKELLKGQSEALDGLKSLANFQYEALEESRDILQNLAKLGHEQQEELIRRQEQLKLAHDHLVENSKSVLSAQEAFEQKQVTMFLALDKLFHLHNALLLESRVIKSLFIYSVFIFIIHMFTSTRQTYNARSKLYMSLCATFLIEYMFLRFFSDSFEKQTLVINTIRLFFVALAVLQLLHSIYTYKDYEKLNHKMLENLYSQVNLIHKIAELTWETNDEEDWSAYVDSDVSDGIEYLRDSRKTDREEQIREYSTATSMPSRKYNLRSRR